MKYQLLQRLRKKDGFVAFRISVTHQELLMHRISQAHWYGYKYDHGAI